MINKRLSQIKKIDFFKEKLNDKEFIKKCLSILGFGSLMSLGGLIGFGLNGLIGGAFGLALGFVAGKLLKV